MQPIVARAYASPNVVVLALDWEAGKTRSDFLGFAIERKPGLQGFIRVLREEAA